MKKLRIIFFGTPDFAVESLRSICDAGYDVAAVVTATDKPAGRGHKMLPSAVKQFAVERGLPVLQPANLKDKAFQNELRSFGANLFVVIAFRMLPEAVWSMPELGTFNLHASLLPRYRGAAPINWAIINGDNVTGVTTFFLKHEIDTGDIIDRCEVAILPDDNVGTLHDRLMQVGAKLTLSTLKAITDGTLVTTPQSELIGNQEPTPAPKIFRDTCHIDWAQPAEKVHNLVRGMSPYPAAWTDFINPEEKEDTRTIKVMATILTDESSNGATPGTVITADSGKRLLVAAADQWIEITELQPSGKRRMTAAEYLRGTSVNSFVAC